MYRRKEGIKGKRRKFKGERKEEFEGKKEI